MASVAGYLIIEVKMLHFFPKYPLTLLWYFGLYEVWQLSSLRLLAKPRVELEGHRQLVCEARQLCHYSHIIQLWHPA